MAYVMFEDLYGSIELVIFPRVLSSFLSLIKTGEIVLVRGRINLREDEETKILADSFDAYTETASGHDSPSRQKSKQSSAPPGLYLRVSSMNGEDYRRASLVTAVFEGRFPLYIRFRDTGKLMRAPDSMSVTPNEVMINELERIVGKENVVFIGD